LAFGIRPVHTSSAAQVVTISNTGTAPLAIASIVATGDFTRTTTCGTSLAVGASCTVSVVFNPALPAQREGLLLVDSNAPGAPHSVGLAGYGVSRGDLDADSRTDIVWHNGATGANLAWLMNVTTDPAIAPVSGTAALPAMADTAWHIACVADMSGDGKADILWRHGLPGDTASGANQVWLMDGATRLAVRALNAQPDLTWQVAGCGDFDADGKSDIVWRRAVNGANALWLVNVTTDPAIPAVKATLPVAALADPTWHIVGVGDYSGDTKADILWRHGLPGETATGANLVWLMDGATRTGSRALNALTDLNWQVAGTGDYEGDGKADILWRHGKPGEGVNGGNQVWLMNGATRLGVRNINAISDLNWQPAP
jgi:hypothetical protein